MSDTASIAMAQRTFWNSEATRRWVTEQARIDADDLALLDRTLRRGRLHGSNDHVAHPRIAPVRAAEHADAQDLASSRVVRYPKTRLLLDHLATSTISCRRQRFMRESGRVSMMRTTSPSFALFSSSCACSLVERLITFL